MIFYVIYGGMKGTTWVQIIKAVLLIIGAAIMTVWVLGKFGFSLSTLLGDATTASQDAGAKDLLQPGLQYKNPVDFISLVDGARARHGGPAARAHALLHGADLARGPPLGRLGDLAHRHLLPLHPRARLRRGRARRAPRRSRTPPAASTRRPRCSRSSSVGRSCWDHLGGGFATILAVVAGLTITASASLSHDIYNTVVKKGKATPEEEVKVARHRRARPRRHRDHRWHLRPGQNIAFLVALAFADRGEREPADDPLLALLEAVQHPGRAVEHLRRPDQRHHADHLLPGRLGQAGRPGDGKSPSMLQGVDFHWFPLDNPGIVSIPLGFLLGYIGTVTSKEYNAAKYAEMEVRSLTGHGAETATHH